MMNAPIAPTPYATAAASAPSTSISSPETSRPRAVKRARPAPTANNAARASIVAAAKRMVTTQRTR
jgi:hypothetical protein